MAECLFLCHRIPYPPNKGDKIRAYHWLCALGQHYRVHLGAFVDDPEDWAHRDTLDDLCDEHYLCPLPPFRARLRSLSGFLKNEALSFGFYRDRGMAHWVDEILNTRSIDVILVFSSTMAPYVLARHDVPRVLDFVDVDSDKWAQYATVKRGPMRYVYRREARQLLAGEIKLASAFDASVFVSDTESDFFRKQAPELDARIKTIENGVDGTYFDPDHAYDNPYHDNAGHRIVFSGTMDYAPNIDAVIWFAESVLPMLRERVPDIQLSIVGARPSPAVRELSAIPGVDVTGSVADMRPYLASARVAVAPMRIARGIQNKVLEALSMGLPVVMTQHAAAGLVPLPASATDVIDEAEPMATRLAEIVLAEDDADVAAAARGYVQRHYDWSQRYDQLLALFDTTETKPQEVSA